MGARKLRPRGVLRISAVAARNSPPGDELVKTRRALRAVSCRRLSDPTTVGTEHLHAQLIERDFQGIFEFHRAFPSGDQGSRRRLRDTHEPEADEATRCRALRDRAP